MANLPAAKKSIRQDKKRRQRNIAIKSQLRTLVKKLKGLVDEGKADEASKMLSSIMSKLDKAAKKGIIKRNNADRKKSKLAAQLAKLKK
jgi:small subunit ribosomal protein S20